METVKKERLAAAGIDVADALSRFMGNENMFERFLGKFLQDKNFPALREALEKGDKEAALAASHTLKGVCGNLSMTALFDLLTEQVRLFRADDFEGAKQMMEKITEQYKKVTDAING